MDRKKKKLFFWLISHCFFVLVQHKPKETSKTSLSSTSACAQLYAANSELVAEVQGALNLEVKLHYEVIPKEACKNEESSTEEIWQSNSSGLDENLYSLPTVQS